MMPASARSSNRTQRVPELVGTSPHVLITMKLYATAVSMASIQL